MFCTNLDYINLGVRSEEHVFIGKSLAFNKYQGLRAKMNSLLNVCILDNEWHETNHFSR